MKAKTIFKLLVTAVLVAAMTTAASAAFAKKNTYNGNFSDVRKLF